MKYTSPTVTLKFEDSPDAFLVFKHPGLGAQSLMGDIRSPKDVLEIMSLIYVGGHGVEIDGKDVSEVPLKAWPMEMALDMFKRVAQEVSKSADPSAKDEEAKN